MFFLSFICLLLTLHCFVFWRTIGVYSYHSVTGTSALVCFWVLFFICSFFEFSSLLTADGATLRGFCSLIFTYQKYFNFVLLKLYTFYKYWVPPFIFLSELKFSYLSFINWIFSWIFFRLHSLTVRSTASQNGRWRNHLITQTIDAVVQRVRVNLPSVGASALKIEFCR